MREGVGKLMNKHGEQNVMEVLREYREKQERKNRLLISRQGLEERLATYRRILKPAVVKELEEIMRRV